MSYKLSVSHVPCSKVQSRVFLGYCRSSASSSVVCRVGPAAAEPASTVCAVDVQDVGDIDRREILELQQVSENETGNCVPKWWEVECPSNMHSITNLQELVQAVEAEESSGRLVVVNFFAPECYACKSLQPKLRQIASNNPDVLFLKVNGLEGDLQAYCDSMGITRIPYFQFYRANKRVAEFTANMRPDKLALLRAEIATHKPQALQPTSTLQYADLTA